MFSFFYQKIQKIFHHKKSPFHNKIFIFLFLSLNKKKKIEEKMHNKQSREEKGENSDKSQATIMVG